MTHRTILALVIAGCCVVLGALLAISPPHSLPHPATVPTTYGVPR